MNQEKKYEVDGAKMTITDIVAACPGVSYSVLWKRLNKSHWHRLEDLRIPSGKAGFRGVKSERAIPVNYAIAINSKGVKRNPKWSLKDIAKKYGISTACALYSMNKGEVKSVACGSRSRLYYDSVEVQAYMRSIGRLPK